MANYETAELCVKAFFKGTPDFEFVYQEDFWANLAPAKAFLIQSFATHNLDNEVLCFYRRVINQHRS